VCVCVCITMANSCINSPNCPDFSCIHELTTLCSAEPTFLYIYVINQKACPCLPPIVENFFFFFENIRVRFLCSLFQSFSARLQPPVLINLRAVRYSGHFYNPITSISKLLLVLLFSFFVLLLYIDDHLFACWLKNAKFSLVCIFVCHIILCCTFTLCCLLIP
jgi:hypothetical protein